MRIAVAGGTGTVGRLAVDELTRRGHDVVILSRNRPEGAAGERHRRVDLSTGEGLPEALSSIELVVDASNVPNAGKQARAVLIDGTGRLLEAEAAAGVGRHVLISIVGIERAPVSYYKVKLAQEAALRQATVAVSVLRATQFHQLIAQIYDVLSRFGWVPLGPFKFQPVDPAEVATALADGIDEGGWDGRRQFAGPEILDMNELASQWRAATGKHRLGVRLPAVGTLARAVKDGALTDASAPRGTATFKAWMQTRETGKRAHPGQTPSQM